MSKVLYIDNTTTYDYVLEYQDKHYVVNTDTDRGRFTYVVFTEYERPSNVSSAKHGDIFYNGRKITYINDIDSNDIITDGYDNFLGYSNENGGLDFARSYIYISENQIHNKYDIFNTTEPIDISYNMWSNLGDYVVETNQEWSYTITPETDCISVENGKISSSIVLNSSYTVWLSYEYDTMLVNEHHDLENPVLLTHCRNNAYLNIYNAAPPTALYFFNMPDSFSVGNIYTPILKYEPEDAEQREYLFTCETENDIPVIEIINSYVGTFKCISRFKKIYLFFFNLILNP